MESLPTTEPLDQIPTYWSKFIENYYRQERRRVLYSYAIVFVTVFDFVLYWRHNK